MTPWEELGRAQVPGGGPLRLMRRGGEFSIRHKDGELMNSRLSGSEEALASLTLARLGRPAARVLIGGLGMGFTLRAALAALGPQAQVEAAEIVPEVIDWARGPMAALFGDSLRDPRAAILRADVADLIAGAQAAYDAILLDVDNGPDGLSRPGNDALYSEAGLRRALRALRPGGALAVWSAAPDAQFTRRLAQAGFAAEARGAKAGKGRRVARNTIWLALRPTL